MPIIDVAPAAEEHLFAARRRIVLKAAYEEISKRSEIGLRRFVTMLHKTIDGTLSVALHDNGEFSMRISVIGRWLCVFWFRDEVTCGYQLHGMHNGQVSYLKGRGAIVHAVAMGEAFGLPMAPPSSHSCSASAQ